VIHLKGDDFVEVLATFGADDAGEILSSPSAASRARRSRNGLQARRRGYADEGHVVTGNRRMPHRRAGGRPPGHGQGMLIRTAASGSAAPAGHPGREADQPEGDDRWSPWPVPAEPDEGEDDAEQKSCSREQGS
jgi:hypothetical protein